jgi:diguanylate cyclase (GGDEF)-like protein
VALALADSLNRAGDYVARYGGEEFVFILPNMTVKQAVEVTEKARLAMMDLAIEHEDSKVNSIVTMSLNSLIPPNELFTINIIISSPQVINGYSIELK